MASAGNPGGGNEGQTDLNRGSSVKFNVTKEDRKTGKVGSGPAITSNPVEPEVRKANDPRLS